MKRLFLAVVLLSLGLCPSGLIAGEDIDRWGFGFQPIIGYDDDASWTFGGNSLFYFNPHPDDKTQELDELNLTATGTLNGGANVHAEITKNLKGNSRELNVTAGCERYRDYFYGTGGNSLETDKKSFTVVDAPFGLSYSFSVLDHFYVSAIYDFLYHDISGPEAEDALTDDALMHSDGTRSSGVGIGLSYRTTNPGIYKRQGFQVGLSSVRYSRALQSSSTFEFTSLSWRYYIPILSRCVLGFNVRGETTRGELPVNYLPTLGGNKLLRGFKGSRYKAKHSLAGQAEFRFPLWWRFGATFFAGAGEVADGFGDFGSTVKAAGGVGFRVAVQKKQNINIRFDLAFNSDGEQVKYIKLKEAF